MARLILYTESPGSPVYITNIHGNEEFIIDLANVESTKSTAIQLVPLLMHRVPLLEGYLMLDPTASIKYAAWFCEDGWPHFEQTIQDEIEKHIKALLDHFYSDKQLYYHMAKLRIALETMCHLFTPISFTVTHPCIAKCVEINIHGSLKISYKIDSITVNSHATITHTDDTLTISNEFKPLIAPAFIFKHFGWARATRAIDRELYKRYALEDGRKAKLLACTGSLQLEHIDEENVLVDLDGDAFSMTIDIHNEIGCLATAMLESRGKIINASGGRQIWWSDLGLDRWETIRFFFGTEEEIVNKLRTINDKTRPLLASQ